VLSLSKQVTYRNQAAYPGCFCGQKTLGFDTLLHFVTKLLNRRLFRNYRRTSAVMYLAPIKDVGHEATERRLDVEGGAWVEDWPNKASNSHRIRTVRNLAY